MIVLVRLVAVDVCESAPTYDQQGVIQISSTVNRFVEYNDALANSR